MSEANRNHITVNGKVFLTMMCVVVCAVALQPILLGQDKQVKDARHYVQEATRAYKEKNYTAFLENMKMAVSLRPTHQTYIYNLAVAYALVGNKTEALAWLSRGADMGLVYPADRDEDFDSIKDSAEFRAILKKIENNRAPINKSSTAFTVKEKGLIPDNS